MSSRTAAIVAPSMPASCISVRPFAAMFCAAASTRAFRCAALGAGIVSSTRSIAASMNTPVGSPLLSRSTRPPSGSFVAAVTRAALQCEGVRERSVAVDAAQKHRMVRHRRVERFLRWELLHRPVVLIPAAADDPLALRRARRALFHARDHFFVRSRVDELHDVERNAEAVEMTVRIGESGDDRGVEERDRVRDRMCPLHVGERADFANHAVRDVDRVIFLRCLI